MLIASNLRLPELGRRLQCRAVLQPLWVTTLLDFLDHFPSLFFSEIVITEILNICTQDRFFKYQ